MSVPGFRPSVLSLCAALCCVGSSAVSETVNYYGLPGYVDLPSAQAFPDGTFGLTGAYAAGQLRGTLAFQFTPALTGSYRYTVIDGFFPDENLTDQSLDLQYQIFGEAGWRPGMRDTDAYTAELVALGVR